MRRVGAEARSGAAAGEERWTVAVDVGGTFTDAVALGSRGGRRVAKVPSTPDDPTGGFLAALDELQVAGVPPRSIGLVAHGTTVATNAVVSGQIARVVLVTTAGFRDLLGYRSGSRPDLYSLHPAAPLELVARCDRLEAIERLDHAGRVVVRLTSGEVRRVAAAVAARRPEAVVVALLFSYRNEAHEVRLARAIGRRLPGVPITRSAVCAREYREYPRAATAALNAALRPVVGRYILRVDGELRTRRTTGPLGVMQSSGGLVAATRAETEAHRLVVSGPAAGASGAAALGSRLGLDRVISMDMGGTSLDVCLIDDGVAPVRSEQIVGGHPILSPAVDVVAIGAGGGSLVRVDGGGRLRVGPASAGAHPGPAAYGRGGTGATVTDAHIVAGTLGADTRLAGRLALDVDAARAAVARVGRQLRLDPEATAAGILSVTVTQIAGALRRVSVERGIDPRGYTLIAFGGAGPLHAGLVLRELQLRQVAIPSEPGCFAAVGLVASDLRIDEAATVLWRLEPTVRSEAARWYRATARTLTNALAADGVDPRRVRLRMSADCCYQGQGYSLAVPLRGWTGADIGRLRPAFDAIHLAAYGHASPWEPVELVTLRMAAVGPLPQAPPTLSGTLGRTPRPVAGTRRAVRLPGSRRAIPVAVHRREAIGPGARVLGPALIEHMDATSLVLPGQVLTVGRDGVLWLREVGRR